jgi:hypothetical protein
MMASPTSSEEITTPVEIPSTPQPDDADLPSQQDLPARLSPTTSMIVAGSSTVADDGASQVTDKFSSPAPVSSSMTPPPSSQVSDPRHIVASPPGRNAATTLSLLSSPPLTVTNGVKRDVDNGATLIKPTAQQLAEANNEELQEMLQAVLAENAKLDIAVREARMSAAHFNLQHNLLTIESEELAKRMEVEHDMTRREVEILQLTAQGREAMTPNNDYMTRVKAYCQSLEDDNAIIYRRLEKAKSVIELKDEQLEDAREEKARLLNRIRDNREHLNYLRSPGGLFHTATSKTTPVTPQQYRSTPKRTPSTNRSTHQTRHLDPIDFLLSVAENNSAPSTPVVSRRRDPRTPIRHNRGVQSLSSLPTTPRSVARPATANSILLPSAQFSPEAEARVINTLGHSVVQQSRERRRKSRDSTISASDNEEIARAAMKSYRGESEDILESQASQSATEMLRIDPRESFEVAASRTTTPTPSQNSSLTQSKIFGVVTKPVVDKRKRSDQYRGPEISPKKIRGGGEAIGLGIGFETRG